MYIADTLSKAYLMSEDDEQNCDDLNITVHTLLETHQLDDQLSQIRKAMYKTDTLQDLRKTIGGWPVNIKHFPECIRPNWNFKADIYQQKTFCILVKESLCLRHGEAKKYFNVYMKAI